MKFIVVYADADEMARRHILPFQPRAWLDDPDLYTVVTSLDIENPDMMEGAERIFLEFNRDDGEQRRHRVRSMCIGDMLFVGKTVLMCDAIGFTQLRDDKVLDFAKQVRENMSDA